MRTASRKESRYRRRITSGSFIEERSFLLYYHYAGYPETALLDMGHSYQYVCQYFLLRIRSNPLAEFSEKSYNQLIYYGRRRTDYTGDVTSWKHKSLCTLRQNTSGDLTFSILFRALNQFQTTFWPPSQFLAYEREPLENGPAQCRMDTRFVLGLAWAWVAYTGSCNDTKHKEKRIRSLIRATLFPGPLFVDFAIDAPIILIYILY